MRSSLPRRELVDRLGDVLRVVLRSEVAAAREPGELGPEVCGQAFAVGELLEPVCLAPQHTGRQPGVGSRSATATVSRTSRALTCRMRLCAARRGAVRCAAYGAPCNVIDSRATAKSSCPRRSN